MTYGQQNSFTVRGRVRLLIAEVTIAIRSKEPRISVNFKKQQPRKSSFVLSGDPEPPGPPRESSTLWFRVRLLRGGIQNPRQQRPGEAGELKGLLGNPAEEMEMDSACVGSQQGAGKKKESGYKRGKRLLQTRSAGA